MRARARVWVVLQVVLFGGADMSKMVCYNDLFVLQTDGADDAAVTGTVAGADTGTDAGTDASTDTGAGDSADVDAGVGAGVGAGAVVGEKLKWSKPVMTRERPTDV